MTNTNEAIHNLTGKDWTYILDKPVAENHVLEALLISNLSGVQISPKQVQALLAMHRDIQLSEANRQRAGFRGRTVASVEKGAHTLAERLQERTDKGAIMAKALPITVGEPEAKPVRKPRQRKAAPVAELTA